jgi:hypothetical protein
VPIIKLNADDVVRPAKSEDQPCANEKLDDKLSWISFLTASSFLIRLSRAWSCPLTAVRLITPTVTDRGGNLFD